MPVCTNCGKENPQKARFCSNCGTPVNKEKPAPGPAPSTPPQPKKKKKGCIGCFFKGILILILILAGAIAVIYFTTDWLDEVKKEWDKIQMENTGTGSSANISSPETNTPISAPTEVPPGITVKESKNIQAIAGAVEEVFEKSDTTALKSILTEASAEKYKGVFTEIQPYMNEYAKAFKTRKLLWSNAFYAIYSFRDEQGTSFSAEFALTEDGNWKLVRF
jgi:hypothetical protein